MLITPQTILIALSAFGTLLGWAVVLWKGGLLVGRITQMLDSFSVTIAALQKQDERFFVLLADKVSMLIFEGFKKDITDRITRTEDRLDRMEK